ncbi:putative bifunctional diguanylate cyclase/phosphodiesterase [Thalassiella azotivora]
MHRDRHSAVAGTRLFIVYAVASLVPVLLLGAGLAESQRRDAVRHGLELGRSQAAVVADTVVAPSLDGVDLSSGLTRTQRESLGDATRTVLDSGAVLALRLRTWRGDVVFDGSVLDGSGAGAPAVAADHPAFRAAADGQVHVRVLPDGVDGPTIRVLQPATAASTGRPVGVLEVVLPYATVADQVEASVAGTRWRLVGGLGALYVVLGAISWSTSRRLRHHARRAARDALHDPLTGLPNRELFRRRVTEATRRGEPFAVVLVDLDRFKAVNDSLGHHAGDQLLTEVARRLGEVLRTDDVVARLGGDEFGLLLAGTGDADGARELADRVREAVSADTVLDGVPVSTEASLGVALHPRDGDDVETLLRSADAAMHVAKRGTSSVVVFDPLKVGTHGPGAAGLSVQREMRRAIEDGELRLHYQPKVDLASGRVTGVEALVRWQHPERGLLPPAEFLPFVEQSGLITPLTEWVLRNALGDCARWRAQGAGWGVAVNVSARNLEADGFADLVVDLVTASGVPTSALQLEVTETALAVDLEVAAGTLEVLNGHGIGTSLDDFGVGYASLSHLRSLAITEVKIDRGFVRHVETSDEDREVVRSLIQLAHGLGLHVTAEGVETAEAATWLQAAGCDSAQGYHFSRPVPWEELAVAGDARLADLLPAQRVVPQSVLTAPDA